MFLQWNAIASSWKPHLYLKAHLKTTHSCAQPLKWKPVKSTTDEARGKTESSSFHWAQHKHTYKPYNFIIIKLILLLFLLHNIFFFIELMLHYAEIVFIPGRLLMIQMTLPNKPTAELWTELCWVTVHYSIHWIPNKILLFCLFVCKVNISRENICQGWRCFFLLSL